MIRARLVFEDWRQEGKPESIYETFIGVSLSAGDLHSGTVLVADIDISPETEAEIVEAWEGNKAYPVFRLMEASSIPAVPSNEPETESKELDGELKTGKTCAEELVAHLRRMGAGNCTISVELPEGRIYEVVVRPTERWTCTRCEQLAAKARGEEVGEMYPEHFRTCRKRAEGIAATFGKTDEAGDRIVPSEPVIPDEPEDGSERERLMARIEELEPIVARMLDQTLAFVVANRPTEGKPGPEWAAKCVTREDAIADYRAAVKGEKP